MMEEKERLMNFIEKFFKNLGADVVLQGEFLIVSNVPENFERFYGKTSPYKFVFDKEYQTGDADLVEKGSHTLKTISSYLENSGQITLLKINFDLDPLEEIKKRLNLANASISNVRSKKKFNFFYRFTFHTTFRYLNEKDTVISDIFVYNGEIIDGNLDHYDVVEGDKKEILIPEMKEPYFLAKDELKKKILPKTEQIVRDLKIRLENEKRRIEDHFFQENKELTESLRKAQEKLLEYEKKQDSERILRQINVIKNLKEKANFEELERDKLRAIHLETQKHMLNVDNKLFNTTLIYYPLFSYDITLKNPFRERVIEVSFDPLTEKLNPLFCEVCERELKEIYLCSNGHVTCEKCSLDCESCGKTFCKKCIRDTCAICNKKICRDCSTRCFKCGRVVCKSHTITDKVSGRTYCNQCLRRCERCGNLKEPDSFKISKKTGAEVCGDCFRKEMQEGVLKGVFD